MPRTGFNLTVGCIVKKENDILLVKHNYGPTKGRWDFPRGYVETGEDIENAAVREVNEETGVIAKPEKIIGIRTVIQDIPEKGISQQLLLIWMLSYSDGTLVPDGREISEVAFFSKHEALNREDVSSWTKEVINMTATEYGFKRNEYVPRSLQEYTKDWRMYSL